MRYDNPVAETGMENFTHILSEVSRYAQDLRKTDSLFPEPGRVTRSLLLDSIQVFKLPQGHEARRSFPDEEEDFMFLESSKKEFQ